MALNASAPLGLLIAPVFPETTANSLLLIRFALSVRWWKSAAFIGSHFTSTFLQILIYTTWATELHYLNPVKTNKLYQIGLTKQTNLPISKN